MARSTGAASPAAAITSLQAPPAVRSTTTAVGRSDVRTSASAAAKASPAPPNTAAAARVAGGTGRILNVASTTTPSVPNEPVKSLLRS